MTYSPLCCLYPIMSLGLQSHGTILLLHPLTPPLSLFSNVMFSFSVHHPPPNPHVSVPRWQKPSRHPETAGVHTFCLRVAQCFLNAHLSETFQSLVGERKKKNSPHKSQPERNEQKITLMTP